MTTSPLDAVFDKAQHKLSRDAFHDWLCRAYGVMSEALANPGVYSERNTVQILRNAITELSVEYAKKEEVE
ncbi:hypothetical protein ANME2D_00706 [Candidatus Methanoperedens nitroreducens]|uniref:Uncharacterized protein n=1 Tax=Candidatus Methanoperedens nitratireducens TaxID=1392998 RepID=A0A062VD93_9EURY|nr:hypothetical protein [Candidatus Methanoperedens nitroreducens]KCZ73634.1 hypothetical protein ANME2D_00706 [Candidatus Methanoperedens nitroreducens]MDJ1422408.1 hypothetical protein [Candidatus Methanoperedens sp.]